MGIKWRWLMLISLFLLVTILPGCGWEVFHQETKKKQETIKKQETYRYPLTGMKGEERDRPILMVIVNNQQQARPQTGLDRADLVVEMLAEGEITRFAAFYHSQQEGIVGPVRSLRPYYLNLAKGLNAVSVHAGGSTEAMKMVKQEKLPSLDGIHEGEQYFWRVDFRPAPHNLYTRMDMLLAGVEETGWGNEKVEAPFLFAEEGAAVEGKEASEIQVTYNSLYKLGYQYDSNSQSYIRYTQGEPHIDNETRQPLTMQNVLVIKAPHQIVDQAGRRKIELDGTGEGYLFQRGKGISIHWENKQGVLLPVADGKVLPLLPGKTWVNVIPDSADVTY